MDFDSNKKHKVMVIAHRGFSGIAPENTLTAFKKAIEIGADMIELDVMLSKDGELVVIHDKTVNRTTNGKGKVSDFTLGELKKLDAGTWFKKHFKDEKIPSLEEVLDLAKNKILLNIEIKKDAYNPEKKKGGVEEKTVLLLEKYNMNSQVIVSSFNPHIVKRIKEFEPEISTAFLYRYRINKGLIKIVHNLNVDALNPGKRFFTKKASAEVHQSDLKINIYTINQKREMAKFIKMGVDGIITNYPDRLFEVLEDLKRTKVGFLSKVLKKKVTSNED
jgi:glycerophosphoryl diester phosphodiesterase